MKPRFMTLQHPSVILLRGLGARILILHSPSCFPLLFAVKGSVVVGVAFEVHIVKEVDCR